MGSLRSGGKERRLVELIKSLRINHKNIIIELVLLRNAIHYKEISELNLDIKHLIEKKDVKKSLSIFIKLYKLVKKIKPDIIHSWGSEETFYIFLIAKFFHIKLINSQVNNAPQKINWFSKFGIQTKINFLFSDVILANSYAGLKSYGIENKKNSAVIHNGFDMRRIEDFEENNIIRKKFNIKTKYVVGMVASFSVNKDYTTYIKAAVSILKQRRDITFLCIGSGDDRIFKKMVLSEFKNKVIFLGRQENVESIMNVCDIGVLSTYTEGISNSIMEFMALGKPVIASDGGGTSELIINNKTGFLIPPKSYKILSNKIFELINNEKERKFLGRNAKERIINEFNLQKMLNSFIKIYEQNRKDK